MTFHGEAEVHWEEQNQVTRGSGENRETHTETVHYRNSEHYFKHCVALYHNGMGSDTHLMAGEHAFPFNFMLPISVPSSFEGAHGNVRYYAKANIDRPWRFDHTTKAFFSVNSPRDLNVDPAAAVR